MENKKISFGFSKLSKPTLLPIKNKKPEDNKIELIKCMEGNEIKLVEEKKEKPPMVIPMTENRTTSSALASLMKRRAVLLGEDEVVEEVEKEPANDETSTIVNGKGNCEESLEQRAVRELLADVRAAKDADVSSDRKLVLQPLKPDELPLDGAKESTLDDYENIPIQEYGLALLRGMGWVEPPKKKAVSGQIEDTPVLRPKGMGLGADKALKKKPVLIPPDANEKLEIKKQAYVCILGGKYKNAYGQIEGFDDEQGRVIVKMAIGGTKESFNEFLCQPVSRKEFAEYGKCINTAKYEAYKRQENEFGQIIKTEKKEESYKDRDSNKSKFDNYKEEKNKQSYNERKIKEEKDYKSCSYARNGKNDKYREESDSPTNSDSSYEYRSRKDKKKHKYQKDDKYRESSSSQKHKESSHKKKTKKSKRGKSRSRSPSRHRR